ncbi:MAG: hypothetical protein KA791_06725 [Flavobacteriales bacterium]|nr:hypothetical protein [Flavobacteriales bacterium]
MKTKTMTTKGIATCVVAGTFSVFALAQGPPDWNTAGNLILGGEWFGATSGSLIPLSFETRANQPMRWSTDNTLHMRLTQTLTGQTINGFGGLDLSGHLGIGTFTSPNIVEPFSLLHLDNGGSQATGYRPWQDGGLTFTQNSDMGWMA